MQCLVRHVVATFREQVRRLCATGWWAGVGDENANHFLGMWLEVFAVRRLTFTLAFLEVILGTILATMCRDLGAWGIGQ